MALTTEGEIAAFGENYTTTTGGFDVVFEDKLLSEQKCPICLLAMRNPVQTICGHRFCESCLLKSFSDHSEQQCPHDRQPIPAEGGWFRDVAWEREILSLRVKCKKSERGCDWTGEIRHYQEHFTVCQYEDVTCDDCNEMMQRGLFVTHIISECPNRIVQCGYCEEDLEFWHRDIHERMECLRFPFPCPQECGMQEIPREEVESHVMDDCMMTMVHCLYEEAGCSFYDKRSSLKAHLEAFGEEHLRKLWSKYLKTTERLNQCETEIRSMKERLDQLEENEEEIRELQVQKMAIKERLTHLEGENCGLQTNTASMTERLNELEQAQLVALEKEKESVKRLLDQKVKDIIGECSSSQKKCEEENKALKEDVAELQRQLEDTKSTTANNIQKVTRVVQVICSEFQAMKGKQPLNLASPVPRPLIPASPLPPNLLPSPMAIYQRSLLPASPPVTRSLDPMSIQLSTLRKPETENTDKTRDPIKRTQAASGSGNPAVKKARIEEATKCKTNNTTSTANGQSTISKQMSRPTETRSTVDTDSGEDYEEDYEDDSDGNGYQAVY